jgi:hypothetical protein
LAGSAGMGRTASAALERLPAVVRTPDLWARPTLGTSAVAARQVGRVLLFAGLPLMVAAAYFRQQWLLEVFHYDFRGTVWEASRAIVDGQSPFPAPTTAAVDVGNPAVYPPTIGLAASPLLLLPFDVAAAFWFVGLLAGVAGALWMLGVRDWRCYVLALTTFPVIHGAVFGNVTLILVLATAVAWRYRDRWPIAAAALGFAIAVKLFLWPLGVWLLATRRFAAAAGAFVGGTVMLLGSWATIGFAGLRDYPDLLDALTHVFALHSNSLYALVLWAGSSHTLAQLAAVSVGALVLVGVYVLARRGDDRESFSAAMVAALVLSPIVWPHYFALLLIPVVLFQPRLGRLWLAAPAFSAVAFLVPYGEPTGPVCCRPSDTPRAIWEPLHAGSPVWQTLAYSAVLTVILWFGVRRSYRGAAT